MEFLYTLSILFYSGLLRFFALFNEKARLFVTGRKGWQQSLKNKVNGQYRYLWFHCASLGEFEQGRPVIEAVKKQFPEFKIVLTFFSPSGYEIRKNYELADVVSYLPLDTKRNARKFLAIVQPEKAFFVKYEFWYHYISELKKRHIPLYSFSAIFRENQQFFKPAPWGKWYRKMLFGFDHFFVQNQKSAELLNRIGLTNFTVSGDTRFDRVAALAQQAKTLPGVERFRGNLPMVVAGSTWKPDEELLAAYINQSSGIKFIIAPHEVTAANINRLQQMMQKPVLLFSKLQHTSPENADVLIIDSIGLLSSIYRYGHLAYIGGGFGVGIHNILEAATFGLPVVFGPNYSKFKEAVDLVAEGGAFPINDDESLQQLMNNLMLKNQFREKAAAIAKNYVQKNVGSTTKIIRKVFDTNAF